MLTQGSLFKTFQSEICQGPPALEGHQEAAQEEPASDPTRPATITEWATRYHPVVVLPTAATTRRLLLLQQHPPWQLLAR